MIQFGTVTQQIIIIKKIGIVSVLFLFYYLLCDCFKLYLFLNNTQQDAHHKGYMSKVSSGLFVSLTYAILILHIFILLLRYLI
jgi:hypothetical protein